jgi:hypothetical protein
VTLSMVSLKMRTKTSAPLSCAMFFFNRPSDRSAALGFLRPAI